MRRTVLAVMIACLLFGGGWAAAQQEAQWRMPMNPDSQDIRTGADLGLRVLGMKDGRVIGTLVVRDKSGQWVEAHAVPSRVFVVPLDITK